MLMLNKMHTEFIFGKDDAINRMNGSNLADKKGVL